MRSFRSLALWGVFWILVAAGPGGTAPAPAPPRKLPRLAFTTYYYWYQADPRKPAPFSRVRRADGSSALITHPWDGTGPWFSYDRVQWHKNQLALMRDTGVDVVLPVYAGGDAAASAYRLKGLACMAQALKEMRALGGQPFQRERGYPMVGMWLDLSALRDGTAPPVDLKTEAGKRALYGAIRLFYRHVPAEFRAAVPLPADAPRRGGAGDAASPRLANVVVLSGASALREWDEAAVAYCAGRFRQEFDTGLILLGASDMRARAPGLDGYLQAPAPATGGAAEAAAPGWLRVATVGPVARREGKSPAPERMGGQTLIQEMLAALRSGPDWLVVESWNRFEQGTEVSPSLEHGLQPRDLTDAGLTQFKGTGDFGAIILRSTVPEVMAPRTLYQVEVLVENTGLKGWGAENRAGLSYRWFQDGKPVGDPGPVLTAPSITPGETKSFTLGLTSPMSGARPLPEGRYELRLDMVIPPDGWFAGPQSSPLSVNVEVGKPAAFQATLLGSEFPTLVKSGGTYTAFLRVRNDGAETWRRGRGQALGYRWRRVSSARAAGGSDTDEALNGTMVTLPLPADVPPGAIIPVPVSVKAAGDGDTPLPPWSPRESWSYDLEWGFYDGEKWVEGPGAPRLREGVLVLASDPGPSFLGAGLSTHLEAGRTLTTKVGLRNTGPDTWKKAESRVGYHWYYFDGTEEVWSGATAPLPKDVLSGETVIVPDLGVRVPDYHGPMYLVFDLQIDGVYASTSENTRGSDILVLPVLITGGRMVPVDLGPLFNADGISYDSNRADGNLDEKGVTLPAETLPPYIWRPPVGSAALQTSLYPCGLWARPVGTYATKEGPITEAVTFRYPEKRDRANNVLSCSGQRVELGGTQIVAVHLLGAATAADASGSFTLVYRDGSTSQQSLTMSPWSAPPVNGEHVAFASGHRHTADGADAPGAYLNHYILRADGRKPLAAVVLPQNPAMKILAVTVEGLEARPAPNVPTGPRRLPPTLQPR